jgi:hypothetical protein
MNEDNIFQWKIYFTPLNNSLCQFHPPNEINLLPRIIHVGAIYSQLKFVFLFLEFEAQILHDNN